MLLETLLHFYDSLPAEKFLKNYPIVVNLRQR